MCSSDLVSVLPKRLVDSVVDRVGNTETLAGLRAFTAAVLGGIGNVPGAMVGGLFLGVIESLGPALFLDGLGVPAPYQLRDVIGFTMLLIMLIFRPQGILGERLAAKRA